MSTPVDDNGHQMLASSFSRKNPNRQYSIKTESGLSRASTATTSSNSSSSSSIRYPSDSTNLTGFSIEQYLSNTPLPPPPSQQQQYHSLANNNNHSNNMELSDDHFDIIDSLNYDDVDDGLIDHEMVHRRRETLVHQLLTSEQAYFESLQVVSNVFIEPLKKDAKQSSFSFLGMKKMICTERETRWLFGNFEEILHVHHEILISLEERLRIWGPTQIISDVFQSWFARMGTYKAYLDNYSIAVTTYERLTRYQPFKKFIDNAHKDAQLKGATLLALLQTPAGCISRYAQLMTRIADATSPMHPDYVQLLQCKQRIVSIAEEMKAKIDDADNVDQVLMIHQALIGAPFGVKAQRRLVLQSSMSISGEERIYILFSDILVFVRPKQDGNRTLLQFKGMVPLERARLKPVHPNTIEITSPFQGVDTLNTTFVASSQAHVLQAESQEDRDRWMERLQKVIANLDRASAKSANKRRVVQARSKDSRSSTSSDRT
ncbi:Dbl homology domain-containing protein [Circinella umbellata]|nr:Dbl homology domain-containing protein [Circinella umbellata]